MIRLTWPPGRESVAIFVAERRFPGGTFILKPARSSRQPGGSMRQICRAVILMLLVVSCESTGPLFSPEVRLAVQQAQWRQQGIHDYSFDYAFSGAWVAPPPVRIVVIADTVRSATVIATGAQRPIAGMPTIDSVFAI